MTGKTEGELRGASPAQQGSSANFVADRIPAVRFFEGSPRCPKASLLSYQGRVKRKRALQRCSSPRSGPVCDAPKVLVARRRSDSAAGCFLGRPHVPDDFGHRSNAFKTSFSEVKPLKSPEEPTAASQTRTNFCS